MADPPGLRLQLLKDTPRGPAVVRAVVEMSDYRRPRSNTMVAGVADVSVDRQQGVIRVHNFWCAIDPGIAVQPDNIVAQTESSIVYGLGLALSDGSPSKNFHDYQVPRMRDVPEMHVKLMPTRNPPTGVGQMATPRAAPAIASAVYVLTRAGLKPAGGRPGASGRTPGPGQRPGPPRPSRVTGSARSRARRRRSARLAPVAHSARSIRPTHTPEVRRVAP